MYQVLGNDTACIKKSGQAQWLMTMIDIIVMYPNVPLTGPQIFCFYSLFLFIVSINMFVEFQSKKGLICLWLQLFNFID